MGIYDRDYTHVDYQPRRSTPSFGGVRMWSITTWLIVINVAVFIVNNLVVRDYVNAYGELVGRVHPIEQFGYFSVATAIAHGQVWRFITFQFLHANLNHILFNMLALYFFGPMIEAYLSSRRYLAFYLICGIAGPLMYIALWVVGIGIHDPRSPMVGASAGIFGVLIAAAVIAPNARVLIYGLIPARLRVVALCALGYALFTVIFQGPNAGGEAAHIGGAIAGAALIKNPQILRFVDALGAARPRMRYRA
jgi:membrane associated rhomboid family serine protease